MGIALLQIDCGWVSATTDANRFADDIKGFASLSGNRYPNYFAKFLLDLLEVAKDFDMEVQPQLALLQKHFFTSKGSVESSIQNWICGQQPSRSSMNGFVSILESTHKYRRC